VWQIAVGHSPRIQNHPLLKNLELPPLGTPYGGRGSNAGPLVTRGALVFVGSGTPKFYAFDTASGTTLWEGDLGGNRGTANPMTYQTRSGRQFVVIATTDDEYLDAKLMAFALPRR